LFINDALEKNNCYFDGNGVFVYDEFITPQLMTRADLKNESHYKKIGTVSTSNEVFDDAKELIGGKRC
jgi:hypothetical protein